MCPMQSKPPYYRVTGLQVTCSQGQLQFCLERKEVEMHEGFKGCESQISILKCPKFWRVSCEQLNLRSNSQKGGEKVETEWGYLYNTDCDICKSKNICTRECKHRAFCKLYVIRTMRAL